MSVCLFVAKDISNRCTDMGLLYTRGFFRGPWKDFLSFNFFVEIFPFIAKIGGSTSPLPLKFANIIQ